MEGHNKMYESIIEVYESTCHNGKHVFSILKKIQPNSAEIPSLELSSVVAYEKTFMFWKKISF